MGSVTVDRVVCVVSSVLISVVCSVVCSVVLVMAPMYPEHVSQHDLSFTGFSALYTPQRLTSQPVIRSPYSHPEITEMSKNIKEIRNNSSQSTCFQTLNMSSKSGAYILGERQ